MKMKTGNELILDERKEQIEKHGWTLEHDEDYGKGELIQAAKFCLDQARIEVSGISIEICEWPENWDLYFENKIRNKSVVQKLTVCGAFFCAEKDRMGDNYDGEFDEIIERLGHEIDLLLPND